mmetsp:Transcript_17531/g.36309  ORF Transcript_17531/g.36309 Transcript_17531/m.36309 type:complete len:330 (+) Transcript_17531:2994-3983(+)
MAESGAEVGDSGVRLLAVTQITLRNEHVAHGEHAEASELLGAVEDDRRETTWHLGVKPDLDPSLNLVLALHEEVEDLLGVDNGLPVVGHEPDESGVPFVGDLREGRGARAHEDLPDPVLEGGNTEVIHPQVGLGSQLLRELILQVPNTVLEANVLVDHPRLWLDPNLEPVHVEEEVRVVLGIDTDETLLPVDSRDGTRQAVLDVPEGSPSEVDVVLHETHPAVPWPALLVLVPHNVLVVGVWVLDQVALNQVLGVLLVELEHHENLVDVAGVHPNGMGNLSVDVREAQVLVGPLRRSRDLGSPRKPEHKKVKDQTVVLVDEGAEFESPD